MNERYISCKENLFEVDHTKNWKDGCHSIMLYGSSSYKIADLEEYRSNVDVLQVRGVAVPVIDLLPSIGNDDMNNQCYYQTPDPWLQNARLLQQSLDQISNLLQLTQHSYSNSYLVIYPPTHTDTVIAPSLPPHLQSLTGKQVAAFENTVATCVMSSTSRIEELRQSLHNNTSLQNNATIHDSTNNQDFVDHKAGILSCLIRSLKEDVMEVFSEMQGKRNRNSLNLFGDPLRVSLPSTLPGNDRDSNSFDDEEAECNSVTTLPKFSAEEYHKKEEGNVQKNMWNDEDELFCQDFQIINDSRQSPVHLRQEDSLYEDLKVHLPMIPQTKKPCKERASKVKELSKNSSVESRSFPKKTILSGLLSATPSLKKDNDEKFQYQEEEANYMEGLQKESALLTAATLQNKLSGVHKVESQMMQITSLLSQFSSLVSQQQDELADIHENTVKSKGNVDKGKDQLIKATERGKKSRHYFAMFITALGILLLFFNWIVP